MRCLAFKALARGAMLGFADLELPSGLILKGCTLLESAGRKWVNPPARATLDSERKPMLDDAGKVIYAAVVDFTTKAVRSKWSSEAVAAIEDYQSKAPAEASAMNGKDSNGGQPQGSR